MERTNILLPTPLSARIKLKANIQGKGITEVIREMLEQSLEKEEDTSLDRLYEGLKKMQGMAKDMPSDASQTIDEDLYGEKGAWRGTIPPNDTTDE